jgi:gas vesicle protein
MKRFSYFVLGFGVGVGLGMLLAPKSGSETRELFKSKEGELHKIVREAYDRARESIAYSTNDPTVPKG